MPSTGPSSSSDLKWIVLAFAFSIGGGLALLKWDEALLTHERLPKEALDRAVLDLPGRMAVAVDESGNEATRLPSDPDESSD